MIGYGGLLRLFPLMANKGFWACVGDPQLFVFKSGCAIFESDSPRAKLVIMELK